jgi:serpin B
MPRPSHRRGRKREQKMTVRSHHATSIMLGLSAAIMIGAPVAPAQMSAQAVFDKHKLLGIFAADCNKPASPSNLFYVSRPLGGDRVQHDQMNGHASRENVTLIDNAAEPKPGELALSGTRDGKPTTVLWRVVQNQVLRLEMSVGDNKLISAGRFTASGDQVPALQKCGESGSPDPARARSAPQASALTDAYNASGLDLLKQSSAGNLVLSPYSVGGAMSMALSGARGETERELISVLRHRLTRPEIEAASREVIATLNSYDRSADAPSCPAGMQLSGNRCRMRPERDGWCPRPMQREGEYCVGGATPPASARLLAANALMVFQPELVSRSYAALLQDKHAAELIQRPTLAELNAWVSRKTEGKIDRILEDLEPKATALVLLNAVYFKSRWASPFDDKLTKTEPFSLSRTQQVQVAMMNLTDDYAVVARRGYRAIRLPYIVPALGMIVVLPNEIDGLGEVVRTIDANEQAALLAALRGTREKPVALALPRFKIETKLDLVPPFRQVGMSLALDRNRADFSGITGRPAQEAGLYISEIRHRATIEVAEESTEAAAATAVVMAPAGGPSLPGPPPEVFRVDRPFLFYIADDATGAILFAGRVSDPSAGAGAVARRPVALPPMPVRPTPSPQPR